MTMRFSPTEAELGIASALEAPAPAFGIAGPRPEVEVEPEEFNRLPEVLTLYHAKRALRRVAERNAYPAFALLSVTTGGNAVGLDMVTSSWPGDPCETLREPSGAGAELRLALVEAIVPFYLSAERRARIGAPSPHVLCLPVYNDAGRGALFFAASREEETGFHAGLHLYALYIFARVSALSRPRLPAAALAPREIDCLRWSAAGKTSGEIAAILGVSENTVNSYLAAAAQKLNAVNRVQTVAQAIRLGLLP